MPRWAKRVIRMRRMEKEAEMNITLQPIEVLSESEEEHLVRHYTNRIQKEMEERDKQYKYILFWMISVGLSYHFGLQFKMC